MSPFSGDSVTFRIDTRGGVSYDGLERRNIRTEGGQP
jgi:hypothetical protein